jgi:hypothetical protein
MVIMKVNSKSWMRIVLINLCLVALLGTVMRYKIAFVFPHFEQKYLQEAHSHFAFSGWITQAIFLLIVRLFQNNLPAFNEKKYQWLLMANLLSAYGMLISFSIQGYGPVSITFASISILTGYLFSFFAYRDASQLDPHHPSRNWIKAAILFGIISTAGTIVLSHMMVTRQYDNATLPGIHIFLSPFSIQWLVHFCLYGLFGWIALNPFC